MQVEFCIDTSVKVGFEYGYNITIVEDAISTFDNEYLPAWYNLILLQRKDLAESICTAKNNK